MSPTLQTLLPAAAGITVVVLGILVFRLHAFLALLLAAAVTAALTPQEAIFWQQIEKQSFKFRSLHDELGMSDDGKAIAVDLKARPDQWKAAQVPNAIIRVFSRQPFRDRAAYGDDPIRDHWRRHMRMALDWGGTWVRGRPSKDRYTFWAYDEDDVIPDERFNEIHPSDLFVIDYHLLSAEIAASRPVPARIAAAFGDTVGSIGLLIAFAAIIGMCLLDSGAADRIVRSALSIVGERGAPLAFAGCGFLLGVPVFFDTVFLLMIPLGKAMRLRTGRNYILYVLTIFCGATMAHSLVPPTPGPLLVAEALGVEVGTMMAVGGAVGLITAGVGIIYALIANRLIDVPLRDTPDMPLAELERLAAKPDHELPPLWLSVLPIVLPVWLIAQSTALTILEKNGMMIFGDVVAMAEWQKTLIRAVGEKNTAVAIGVVAALILLIWQTRQSLAQARNRVGAALASGGMIILITAAGGAFGDMIEQTGVASLIKQMPTLGPAGLLTVAFLVTTTIRTAQGSATVAMITSVGLFAGLDVPFHPVWLALAIGCGSKPISWMTDSGFWVICKMSGMTEVETLKTLTPMTVVMGLAGLVVVIVGATLFPMN